MKHFNITQLLWDTFNGKVIYTQHLNIVYNLLDSLVNNSMIEIVLKKYYHCFVIRNSAHFIDIEYCCSRRTTN